MLDPVGFEQRLESHNPVFYLAQRCWFDNDPSLLHEPLHRDRICKALLEAYQDPQSDRAGDGFFVQRESYKSTFAQGVFPMFILLRGKHIHNRDERILLLHHKEQQASANLQLVKSKLVQHPWLKEVWPEFCMASEEGTKLGFDTPCKNPGIYHENSVMAAGLGARMVGYHFDWIICDDIVTDEHINSKQVRDDAFQKYQTVRFMLDTIRGKVFLSGTFYHPNDLWQKLIKSGNYRLMTIAAGEVQEDGSITNLSFPNRHTEEFLLRRRKEEADSSGNDDLWWLQYMLAVKSRRKVAADLSWLQECTRDEVPWEAMRLITVDPAWKGTKNQGEGDDAAIAVLALAKIGSIISLYILDGIASNEMTDGEGRSEIFRYMNTYGVINVAPEEIGGQAFRQSLRNEAVSRGTPINVIDLKTRNVGKQYRISALFAQAENRRVFLCSDCDPDFAAKFRSQFADYPQLDHEDVLDAVAYAYDPEITENYAPRWNQAAGAARQPRQAPVQRRTRYCGI